LCGIGLALSWLAYKGQDRSPWVLPESLT
jgi:hypothetical protein